MKFHVEEIPWFLKPLFWIYSYGCASLGYLFTQAIALTCRIETKGLEALRPDQPYVFAMWHTQNLPAFTCSFFKKLNRKFALMNHPAWYMKPIHLWLTWLGVERLVLGSTGNKGRKAADEVVELLRKGWSTHINPDGPAGPAKVIKKGVLHMAAQSGVKIVAVKFICRREWVLHRTWDQKRLPMPFSTILVQFEAPYSVVGDDLDRHAFELAQKLS